MADPMRLLAEIQGWAVAVEAHHDEVMRNLALERAGHPRAQDFEPTGHGGSDPTSVNGTRPDTAVAEGKRYIGAIERAQKAMREADDISYRHRNGIRPERQPDDAQDVWCVLHLELDAHEPRYRNELCRPCAERKYATGDFPSLADVRWHIVHGRWPRQRVDPTKPQRIAGADRLVLGAEAITADTAAGILLEGTA